VSCLDLRVPGKCAQTNLEADRQVAKTLAELILGGALTSAEVTQYTQDDAPAGGKRRRRPPPARRYDRRHDVYNRQTKGPFHDRKGPLAW
jgi:hypothetical protein